MNKKVERLLSLLLAATIVLSLFSGAISVKAAEVFENPVEFLIKMTDSYGDSWSGCGIGVYEGETLVTVATVSEGSAAEVTVPYIPGIIYSFRWVEGDYSNECFFEIWINNEAIADGVGSKYFHDEIICVLEKLCNHEYVTEITPPTCFDPGFTRKICVLCEKEHIYDECPATGHSYDDGICVACGYRIADDCTYEILSEGTCSITGYNGTETMLDLPSVIDGYLVTHIGSEAFSDQTQLKKITLPDSVISIGSFAFSGCTGLTEITIPQGVTSIENHLFSHCRSLTKVTIPDSVSSIKESAFNYCFDLAEITIPDGVTEIGANAFSNCSTLNEITIPESVISIGKGVFNSCDYLRKITVHPDNPVYTSDGVVLYSKDWKTLICAGSIVGAYTIPDSVTSILGSAFSGCEDLLKITIPNSITAIDVYTFSDCSGLTEITLPDSITSIGYYAFRDCTGLTEITIPDSVTSIGYCVFDGCSNLRRITYFGDAPRKNSRVFYGVTADVYTPCGNSTWVNPGQLGLGGTITWKEYHFLANDHIDEAPTCTQSGVKTGSCSVCNQSMTETIPATGHTFEDGVCIACGFFEYSYKILSDGTCSITGYNGNSTSLIIPSAIDGYPVSAIGGFAFQNCYEVVSVTIPEGVVIIGDYAFTRCYALEQVSIPDSVTAMNNNVFANCDKIEYNYYENAKYLGNENNPYLRLVKVNDTDSSSVTIHEQTKYICGNSFFFCENLEYVHIPESVTVIGDLAFHYCDNLTEITIPANVSYIGSWAFPSYGKLSTVTFMGDPPQFQSDCFYATTVTVYYPAENLAWTEDVRQDYEGYITWIPYGATESGITLSGKLTSFGSDTESLTVELWIEGTVSPAYTAAITDGSYSFENIPEGNYILKISMEHGVTRSYPVNTESEEIALDVKISPMGDISGDGKLNVGDVARAYSHARGSGKIEDDYAFSCGDVNSDGKINVGDAARIYGHIKGTNSIW